MLCVQVAAPAGGVEEEILVQAVPAEVLLMVFRGQPILAEVEEGEVGTHQLLEEMAVPV
jgi:hypothetical protein